MRKEDISKTSKEEMAKALLKLMKYKPLKKITIAEITGECGFPRSTFYYHFEDIYDFTAWVFAELTIRYLTVDGICCPWGSHIITLFKTVQNNEEVVRGVIYSEDLWRIANKYCDLCMRHIEPSYKKLAGDREIKPEALHFIGVFTGHAFLDTLMHWLRHGMKESPEQLVSLLNTTLERNMPAIFDSLESWSRQKDSLQGISSNNNLTRAKCSDKESIQSVYNAFAKEEALLFS